MAFQALPQPPMPALPSKARPRKRSAPLFDASGMLLFEDPNEDEEADALLRYLAHAADQNDGDTGYGGEHGDCFNPGEDPFDVDPFEDRRPRQARQPLTPVTMLGPLTARDLIVARAMGHPASAFEALFKTNALALIIELCVSLNSFSARSEELFEWALSTGANANELAQTCPEQFLSLMAISSAGARQGALMLSAGARLPAALRFGRPASRSGRATGTALHKLVCDFSSSPTLVETALALADGADLSARDSQGLTVCGRINHELAEAPSSARSGLLRAFAALVALGADASDLSPCPTRIAADPAIARAAQVAIERKALLLASAPESSRSPPTRL